MQSHIVHNVGQGEIPGSEYDDIDDSIAFHLAKCGIDFTLPKKTLKFHVRV
jgi:hypothetical protein